MSVAMVTSENDSINIKGLTPDYDESFKRINVSEYNFLPSIEIQASSDQDSLRDLDFYKEDADRNILSFDAEKLSNYAEFAIVTRIRDGIDNRYAMTRFRNCEEEDFTQNNFKVYDDFRKVIPKRMCPDVSESFSKFYSV
jgi:hypothetical protein